MRAPALLLLLLAAAAAALATALAAARPCAAEQAPEPAAPPAKKEACWRNALSRGRGHYEPEDGKCKADEERGPGGMCYKKCNDLYSGLGPVCWADCSKTNFKTSGLLFCCADEDTCGELLSDLAKQVPKDLVKLAVDISVNPANILKLLSDFKRLVEDGLQLNLPLCLKQEDEVVLLPSEVADA